MDTIATIIVTAFLTSLITGIVSNFIFLRRQKGIEASFAQQLEKFRANLQYSNFEQQTKFVSTHTKRLETLQTLYKKFAVYRESFGWMMDQISYYNLSNNEKVVIVPADYGRIGKELADFRAYFVENRLFLTEDIGQRIERIYQWSNLLYEEVHPLLPFFAKQNPEFSSGIDYNAYLKRNILSDNYFAEYRDKLMEDIDDAAYAYVLGTIDNFMYGQIRELEDIYKSVAGDKHID